MKTTLHSLTDSQLVELYADGSNAAFEILLGRHKMRLYNYILYSVRNEALTEDIFQETFIKAIVSIQNHTYEEKGHFYAWLTRIAHNLIMDHYRANATDNAISKDECEYDILNDARLSDTNIEDEIIHEQQLVAAEGLLDYLSEEQRQVIRMRLYDDLSFNEIAELTGVSINTALGRMRYALINLRRLAVEHSLI